MARDNRVDERELATAPPGFFPPEQDADSKAFWEAARQHRFLLQQCGSCHTYRWPPRVVCWACVSREVAEVSASGRGTVSSWTVIHHATTATSPDQLPYTVVLVSLDEDPRILVPGQLDGDRHGLYPGAQVETAFKDVTDEVTVVHWRFAGT